MVTERTAVFQSAVDTNSLCIWASVIHIPERRE